MQDIIFNYQFFCSKDKYMNQIHLIYKLFSQMLIKTILIISFFIFYQIIIIVILMYNIE
jgi:hypothetical protein